MTKQQAKHTPGPYRYGDFKMSPSIIAADGTRITELVARDVKGEMDANGELFAAAPETAAERDQLKSINAELLAALKLVRDEYCEGGVLDGTAIEKAIVAAIAKAEGGR